MIKHLRFEIEMNNEEEIFMDIFIYMSMCSTIYITQLLIQEEGEFGVFHGRAQMKN